MDRLQILRTRTAKLPNTPGLGNIPDEASFPARFSATFSGFGCIKDLDTE